MVDRELLELLACPESRQRLHEATPELLARVNTRIARGELANLAGTPLRVPLAAALVREDGKLAYPVLDGIPMLIRDEAFSIDGSG